ncbi:hypothetical protein [Thalassolituus oleivorans]|uniref:hypothetical protein n=1 Tax=Thalassolituus oleivorans TaxID=187493 RepID=UPI0023F4B578|nr:hypothetical protein [Thalassolituus oleivorans]
MIFGSERHPKGPKWSKATRIVKDLTTATLEFKAPLPSPPFADNSWAEEGDHFSTLDFNNVDPKDLEEDEHKTSVIIYSNSWEYRGLPVLQGYCGDIGFFVTLSRLKNHPINSSLLTPETLANAVLKEHDVSFLSRTGEAIFDDPYDLTELKWPVYLGPINSQWLKKDNIQWLYCESQPLFHDQYIVTYYAALSHDAYVSFQFLITRSAMNAGNAYRIEQRIPLTNFLTLVHNIMDSVKIRFSDNSHEEELNQKNAAHDVDMPVIEASSEYIELAKHVLYMWSARQYTDTKNPNKKDHRAAKEDVADFIDAKVTPRPLPNSLPRGEVLYRYFDMHSAGDKNVTPTTAQLTEKQ